MPERRLLLSLPGTAFRTNHRREVDSSQGAKVELLGDGYAFTEGPAVDAEGNVYFTDQPNDKIIRWSAGTDEFTTDLYRKYNENHKGQLQAAASCRDRRGINS